MRDAPALIANMDQVTGVATVTVCGEYDAFTFSRLRDRLVWVAANSPQRLVLDLGASGRSIDQLRALIAARRQVPAGCLLEVRSASPAARNLLRLAGWVAWGSGHDGLAVTWASDAADHGTA